jgi:hypothetical protein
MARFLGIVLFVMGISLVVNRHGMQAVLESTLQTPGLRFLVAIFPLFLGSYLIVFHNQWQSNAGCLVAFLGWVCFVAGVFRTGAPQVWLMVARRMQHRTPFAAIGIVVALYGTAMLYFGYFAMI